jgi:hypothetical protein
LRQIRPIVDFDNPDFCAMDLRDQCVASFGVCSNVATSTCSTWSMVIDRGRPAAAHRPNRPDVAGRTGRRRWTNWPRHLPTVGRDTRKSAAT